jgi:predicted TPR repeat methyltransferase
MSSSPDQGVIQSIAAKTQSGDFVGARSECERFLAQINEPPRRAPMHFWLGVIERRAGALARSAQQFELALAINRRDPQWLFQAGVTYFQLNDPTRAEPLYREALTIEPRMPLVQYNLGVLLQQKRDWPGARAAFEAALALQPQFAEAWTNLGNTLLEAVPGESGREQAERCYQNALSVNPTLANAHHGIGLLHAQRQNRQAARQSFTAAVTSNPSLLDAWMDLAECEFLDGNREAAQAAVERVLAQDPDHASAKFKLAQYRGDQPDAAPTQMVERLYAGMAATFDEHLTGRLGYRIPALLMTELRDWLSDFPSTHDGRKAHVLDLGCGTGLFGVEVRPFAERLAGVDLSAAMLQRARDRGLYDQLFESDLLAHLSVTPDRFDLIAATDVFIYQGTLDDLFAQIATHLNEGARFAFSTETPAGMTLDFQLLPTGRYAHAAHYIERLAADNHLALERRIDTTIRAEGGVPLAGHVFILGKS